MVTIHYVNVALLWIDSVGNVLHKNDPTTTLNDMRRASEQQHRIIPRLTGPCSTANSADYPDVPTYLAAEAADGFALAYMDQYTIVTQMIV